MLTVNYTGCNGYFFIFFKSYAKVDKTGFVKHIYFLKSYSLYKNCKL